MYQPGGYDRYGNYFPGGVSVQTYNVPGNNVDQGYGPTNQYYGGGGYGCATNPNCNPARTLLGGCSGWCNRFVLLQVLILIIMVGQLLLVLPSEDLRLLADQI
jgi:hypothetical protein